MLKDFRNYIAKSAKLSKRFLILGCLIVGSLILLAIALEILWALLGFPIWRAIDLMRDQEGVGFSEIANTVQPLILEGLKAVLPSLSGVGLSAAAIVALLNFQVAQDKQVTDVFVKAIEMLGHDKLEVRIGGIFALERIAKNSDKDHWTIMQILADYIRKDSIGGAFNRAAEVRILEEDNEEVNSQFVSADIQSAIDVIAKNASKDPKDGRRIVLNNINLNGAVVDGGDFTEAIFIGTNFHRATLLNSAFKGAELTGANLTDAFILYVDLTNARLIGASLHNAHINGTVLTNTDIRDADLRRVKGRKVAQLLAARNWWLAKYDDKFAKELTEFAQKQAEHEPKFVEQLRLFEQHRQAQDDESEDPSDRSG